MQFSEVPAFGGETRFVARYGLHPKYSPDGSQVTYWVGSERVGAAVPGSGAVWVVPANGGSPQRVAPNFTAARHPVWSADGKRILLLAYTASKPYQFSSLRLVARDINGSFAVKTGAYEAFVQAGWDRGGTEASSVQEDPWPGCWSAMSNAVIFSMAGGDTNNLWEIGISPKTGKVSGLPKRLTVGAGKRNVSVVRASRQSHLYQQGHHQGHLVPTLRLDRGSSKGVLERIMRTDPPTGNIHLLRVMGAMLRLLPTNRVDPTYGFANWQQAKSRAWPTPRLCNGIR